MNPKLSSILIASTLLLTACPATTAPPATVPPKTSVSGTVVIDTSTDPLNLTTSPWIGETGTVSGVLGDPAAGSLEESLVATGALAASGGFTLALPPTVASAKLSPFNASTVSSVRAYESYGGGNPGSGTCTGAPTFSTPSAHATSLILFIDIQDSLIGVLRNLSASGTTQTTATTDGQAVHEVSAHAEGNLIYADMPVTVSGTVTCSAPITRSNGTTGTVQGTTIFNLSLTTGWNKVTSTSDTDSTVTTTAAPSTESATLNLSLKAGLPSNIWVLEPIGVNSLRVQSQPLFRR